MQREYLFRGIREDNGEWVYGDLIESDIKSFILPKDEPYLGNNFPVKRETVGQYTGLKDKNGKEIYEDDILEIKTQSGRIERFTVTYATHRRDMKSGWTVDIPGFAFVNSEGFPTFPIVNNYLNGHDLDIIEVVGNIHQNPELLTK